VILNGVHASVAAVALGWLIPRPDEPGAALAKRTFVVVSALLVFANLVGVVIVFVLAAFVFPLPEIEDDSTALVVNLAVLGGFLLVVMPVGTVWGYKRAAKARDWLREDRQPTEEERRLVLQAPRRIVFVHVVLWSVGAVFFGALNAFFSFEMGQRVLLIVAFGGITTCAIAYLISERQLRPIASRALAAGVGDRRLGPRVTGRALMAWLLGSALPVLGLMSVGMSVLIESDFNADELAIAVLALGGLALSAGFLVSLLAARAIADPVVALRKAVNEVEEGNLDTSVSVYDGSEIGQLQTGFNSMVAGLRERERVQDLFGRHVGEDVARAALEEEIELGGETREVAVLFTDIIGSTALAAERPPHEVVELLNRFFTVVVEVVRRHGGWVNKFEGDAALAIFGAPAHVDDAFSRALAAARELSERLPRETSETEAAIGVSAGEVVAGNIGEESRFEYTVIGDPVNEAARLTELAKEKPERLLASEAIVERASSSEAAKWELGEAVELRGRTAQTRLATPRRTSESTLTRASAPRTESPDQTRA
jgi:adenylate cyclase